MSSKGTPVTFVRMSRELVSRISDQARSITTHTGREVTVSHFLREAAEEKLKKMARSRRARGRKQTAPAAGEFDAYPSGAGSESNHGVISERTLPEDRATLESDLSAEQSVSGQ